MAEPRSKEGAEIRRVRRARSKIDAPGLVDEFLVAPAPEDPSLTECVRGFDQDGAAIETSVVVERPLTLFLNGQEIVTMMTIADFPDYLAVGYLLNQNMLRPDDVITAGRARRGARGRRGPYRAADRLRGEAEEEDARPRAALRARCSAI